MSVPRLKRLRRGDGERTYLFVDCYIYYNWYEGRFSSGLNDRCVPSSNIGQIRKRTRVIEGPYQRMESGWKYSTPSHFFVDRHLYGLTWWSDAGRNMHRERHGGCCLLAEHARRCEFDS